MMMDQNGVVAVRFAKLELSRQPFLERARECAKLTIPGLLPPDGHKKTDTLPTPWQSVGARGVNNLANKLLLASFPANTPFFRYTIDDFMLEQLTQKEGARAEVEEAIGKIERALQNEINDAKNGYRVILAEALKHLVVTGNILLYMPRDGQMRLYHLDRFVVRRDVEGNVLEIITVEFYRRSSLPAELIDKLPTEVLQKDPDDQDIPLFTRIYVDTSRNGNRLWRMEQEIAGVIVNRGTYRKDRSPWLPLRWTSIANEDYGRGYIEEYFGDLKSLESLSETVTEGVAVAAKVVIGKKPNSSTNIRSFAKARNGDIIVGDLENDLTTWQAEKTTDLRVAKEHAVDLERRLNMAFLMSTQAVRDAERVTAEEIRLIAGELEDALGGVYSLLSQELQLPFIERIQWRMESRSDFPRLEKSFGIRPTIVTGVEALGRGQDITNLRAALEDLSSLGNIPPELSKRISLGDLVTRVFTARGIDAAGLVLTEEQIQAADQQAMMQQMMMQGLPNAVTQGGQMLQNAQTANQEEPSAA